MNTSDACGPWRESYVDLRFSSRTSATELAARPWAILDNFSAVAAWENAAAVVPHRYSVVYPKPFVDWRLEMLGLSGDDTIGAISRRGRRLGPASSSIVGVLTFSQSSLPLKKNVLNGRPLVEFGLMILLEQPWWYLLQLHSAPTFAEQHYPREQELL